VSPRAVELTASRSRLLNCVDAPHVDAQAGAAAEAGDATNEAASAARATAVTTTTRRNEIILMFPPIKIACEPEKSSLDFDIWRR
jgi:hypothetical protein